MADRVLEILCRSRDGRAAFACIGASRIKLLAESADGQYRAWQEMIRCDGKIGLRHMGDLWQRVQGAIMEARP
jgi:hypothetical protein